MPLSLLQRRPPQRCARVHARDGVYKCPGPWQHQENRHQPPPSRCAACGKVGKRLQFCTPSRVFESLCASSRSRREGQARALTVAVVLAGLVVARVVLRLGHFVLSQATKLSKVGRTSFGEG